MAVWSFSAKSVGAVLTKNYWQFSLVKSVRITSIAVSCDDSEETIIVIGLKL